MGFAASFHASATILLPVYIVGLINWNIRRIPAMMIFTAYLLLFGLSYLVMPFFREFIHTYFSNYEIYDAGAKFETGVGILYFSAIFALILFFERVQTQANSLLFKIAIISFIFSPLGLGVQMLGRVAMYMQPTLIAVIPTVLSNIKDRSLRIVVLASFLVITMYSFYSFFQSDVWGERFRTYKTIFSASEIY